MLHKAIITFAVAATSEDVAGAKMAVIVSEKFRKIYRDPMSSVEILYPLRSDLKPSALYRRYANWGNSKYDEILPTSTPPPDFRGPDMVWPIPFPPLEDMGKFNSYKTHIRILFRLASITQSFEESVQWVWNAFDNLPTPDVELFSVEEDRITNYSGMI